MNMLYFFLKLNACTKDEETIDGQPFKDDTDRCEASTISRGYDSMEQKNYVPIPSINRNRINILLEMIYEILMRQADMCRKI